MWFRWLPLVAVSGCGQVTAPPDAAIVPDADLTPAVTYRATLDKTPAVRFGGVVYCLYSITLKQLDVTVAIRPSGEVTSATVQDLNFEEVVPVSPPCPNPPAPATIANYSLDSATRGTGGTTRLTFKGAATNAPTVALVGDLTSVGTVNELKLGFMRTDQQEAELAWSVLVTLPLRPL